MPPLRASEPAAAAVAPAAVADAATGSSSEHVVRAGESLWTIAQRFGITVAALAAENSLSARDPLQVGQRLRVPAAGAAPAQRTTHRVRAGETLSRIASSYGVSVRAIMDANRLASTVIQIGQTLRIPAES
jgi:N-acetylmuramoyl-L-alanine amidase